MSDEYVYFLFDEHGEHIRTSLRRPHIKPGRKCVAVFANRLILGAEEQK